jgi:hypothetical protein
VKIFAIISATSENIISSGPRNRVENKNTLDLRILGIAGVCNTFDHDTDCSHTSVSVFPFLFGQTNPHE